MPTTIEGVYRDGRVELSGTPEGAEGRPVLVTFLERNMGNGVDKAAAGRMITFGMFPELNALTDDDFKAAEFHGESDDGPEWP